MAEVREVNWLELPDHLTVLVTDKLSRCNFIRFGAVCKYWQSIVVAQPRRSVLHQLPLLLRACSKDTFDIHNIYECIEKRTYNFQVLIPHAELNLGSSHGWVVTKWIEDADEALTIFLTNPFLTVSDNTIKLPLIHVDNVDKVVLSANPASNPNYVVMVIVLRGGKLAFYNPSTGKDDWTYEEPTLITFDDALYYRDQFYLVDSFGSLFNYHINHRDHHPGLSLELASPPYPTIELAEGEKNNNHYLAELSSGDLILVRRLRTYNWLPMGMYFTYYTRGFSVHKMNQVEHKWMEVQNLCGDTLFLDDWKSSSFRASDFPGCKPNCIYFIDGGLGYFDENDVPSKTEYIGTFNVEDGSIERQTLPIFRSKMGAAYPIWIEPRTWQ